MILLFGPVGAGKSVQGEILSEKLGWKWLSTGQMFRSSQDPEVKRILASGELIDDETTYGVVQEAFAHEQNASRIILDGFPRTMAQAEWLERPANGLGRNVALVLVLEVSDEEITNRLAGRGRIEDTPDKIKRRMEIYRADTNPILEYLESKDVVVERVNGEGSVNEINDRLVGVIKKYKLAN
ncbi:nucleoside monophosphate kinase [Candidatus Saccharibacteria bacterium]|nr:nucleoside monophosphate kinase [Candidatus Saccharibacteria bacterium]